MTPFLSIVTPTFNRRESLQVTLDGLARQTFPASRFELVLVSDGSTDGTDEFLSGYAAPYTLRAIRQDNAGPARARNRGIQEARGEVVIFLDDDVEPLPEFLAAHAAHHEKDERLVVVGPQSRDPARKGREPLWIDWEHAMLEKQYDNWRTGVWPSAGPRNFYTGNASVRRAHLLAVGGFNETFKRLEDIELAHRMERERHVHFIFDPAPGAIHRPTRTFASWLNTSYAYGRLDAQCAREGSAPWRVIEESYWTRNRITRSLARLTLPRPALSEPARRSLLASAQVVARTPGMPAGLARGAMSTLYNLRYLEGVRDELGSWEALRAALHLDGTPPISDGGATAS